MDPTEDLSARVLLKHILTTEPPRTPVTRSNSQELSISETRRSSRLSKKDAGPQTPQEILRRSMRHKLHESITRKSLPATKRRTASVVFKKVNMPATSSVLINDGDTPRHILMNILRTEPVKSPVVHEKETSEEPEPPSANSTISKTHSSMELSGLDLPDVTIGQAASTAKGLSRKRPRRSFNTTAFEKRLKDGDEAEEETEQSIDDTASLSVLSSPSLNLKTPFVDAKTEKRGLQRRVSNRRKISEEEFGAAVDKRQMGGMSSFGPVEQGLGESTHSEGFTLGLSKLSEPDITADIVNCNTALYAQADAMTSNFSIIATQDKPTVMGSQLQKDMREMELEEQMEVEQSKLETDQLVYVFPTEDESEKKEARRTVYNKPEDVVAKSDGDEDVVKSQMGVSDDAAQFEEGEDGAEVALNSDLEQGVEAGSQAEEEAEADSKTEEEEEEDEEGVVDSNIDGGTADSQFEKGDDAGSQSEDENVAEDQTEEEEEEEDKRGVEESQTGSQSEVEASTQSEEEDVVPDSQTEKVEEDGGTEYHTDEVVEALPEEDVSGQSERNEHVTKSENENDFEIFSDEKEEEASSQLKHDSEHINRRAYRSEGGLTVPVTGAAEDFPNATFAGWPDAKFKGHGTLDLHTSFEMGSHESGQTHTRDPDVAESSTQGQAEATGTTNEAEADKENSFPLPEGTYDIEDGRSETVPDEAPAEDPAEPEEELEEEEEDDEEDEASDFPCKTPAFVREKINFNRPDPSASPSILKNNQASTSGTREPLPAAKPKQRRVRKTKISKKETVLPKSYLMGVFKHFAKTKVSADVHPVLNEIMDKFFDRLAEDLETYAVHAKRKTIEVEDVELLLKRQGYVNDKVPVEVLIEKYLRMDQRRLLIPIATSGNVVIPAKRR
ncbi:eukaryotic translation initiation factor 5B [Oreochromis niloticus]|uniref:CENP-T/Histone H4 histone fold domain-containing protein n=1 Tax=Oreochromis niloticus TaxID=8128 RepID=I3K0E7_ORENI|nr:centromere protein T [Oreochromis niloticus]XP_005463950.1 centromere protein T [Oreochromis niloticus]